MPTHKLASLSLSRAYIETIRGKFGALGGAELIDALERLDRAYDEFPELELDRPRRAVLEGLQFTAEHLPDRAAIPLLMYCVAAADPSCPSALASLVEKTIEAGFEQSLPAVLRSLCRCREFFWPEIELVANVLRKRGRPEALLQLISEVLSCTKFTKAKDVSEFGDVLTRLLSGPHRPEINNAMLAGAVRSARHRLSPLSVDRGGPASREAPLARAERLRATLSPPRFSPHPNLGWPSGRLSFQEFLLQWPCEVKIPVELNDHEFIETVYRTILLREPDIAEKTQYLRLLKDSAASKSWIIEYLVTSKEFRSLERRLRVICDGRVITEPGGGEENEMPAVTWPWRSTGDV
jgi:Domain of unknown function (DUF4214)